MNFKGVMSFGLGFGGFLLVFISILPILIYEWESGKKYPTLISPLSFTEEGGYSFFGKDYTKSGNWFLGKSASPKTTDGPKYYTVSIPKLGIENAFVRVDSDDLAESLIQYEGSPPPGSQGNTVILGHSTLPIFFDPENYISIFSTLHKLNKKDEVFVHYGGIIFRFEVESMFEVKPTEVEVLEPGGGDPYLTLITCSPPGDPRKPKRLIVRAKISPPK